MKPLIFLGIGVAVFTVGALLVITRGVEPKPTYIMKPTSFENPSDLGKALAQRFYYETKTLKSFAFFDSPFVSTGQLVFEAFMNEANKNVPNFRAQFVQRAGVNLPISNEDFQLVVSPVVPNSDSLDKLPFKCEENQSKSLACLATKASSAYYRRPLPPENYGAMMYKYSKNLHVLYIWEPK